MLSHTCQARLKLEDFWAGVPDALCGVCDTQVPLNPMAATQDRRISANHAAVVAFSTLLAQRLVIVSLVSSDDPDQSSL